MSRELCWWSRIHYITSKRLTAVWECACALTFHHHTHTHTHWVFFFVSFYILFLLFLSSNRSNNNNKNKKMENVWFPVLLFLLCGSTPRDFCRWPIVTAADGWEKKSRVDRVMSDWPLNQIIPSNNKQTTTTTKKRKFSQTSKFGKKIKDVAITRFPNLIQVAYDDSAYYVVVVLLRNMYYASVHDCGCAGIGLDGRRRS